MTLTIHTEEDSQRQLAMTIEVDEARVQKAMRQKARQLAGELTFPGFRPGKAPYQVIVRRVGEEALRAEAVEDMAQAVFEEALAETDTEPYGRASLDDLELDPVVMKFTVPLSPVVTLADYRSYRKELEPAKVEEEAVQEALDYIQTRHQTLEEVDRPAQPGDVVAISGSGRLLPRPQAAPPETQGEDAEMPVAEESETIFDDERLELLLEEKTLFSGTTFFEQLVGMSAGDSKSFQITFPDDYEDNESYSGREAAFDITLLNVQKRELPPVDDELAKMEGNYETLDELIADIRKELLQAAENASKGEVIEEMLDHLIEGATIVYPPAAVEAQIDDMVEDFKARLARSGWQVEDYLRLQGLTDESLREDFRENAEQQLVRQLALRQFVLDEKLRVEMKDVEEAIERRLAQFDNEGLKDAMRNYYRSGRGLETVSSEALSDKVYERMRAIMAGEAPDLAALAAEAEAEEVDEEE